MAFLVLLKLIIEWFVQHKMYRSILVLVFCCYDYH